MASGYGRACQEGQRQHPPPAAGGRAHIHIAATLAQVQCRRSYFVARPLWTVIGVRGAPPMLDLTVDRALQGLACRGNSLLLNSLPYQHFKGSQIHGQFPLGG